MTILRLRDVAQVLTSNVDKVIDPEEHQVRLCNYVDVYKNNFIESDMRFNPGSATTAEIEKFNLIPGDVIITKDSETRDDIGVPAFVKSSLDDLVCGYHLSILRANPSRMVGAFLYWHLLSKRTQDDFANNANGVTRFGLTLGGIKSIPIHVPDLATQRRIADFLDRETARIDLLIEKKQRLVEVIELKRSAAITRAVTQGIDATSAMKESGIDWVRRIPAHWTLTKLGYLGRCANGINIGGDAFGSGYPFVSYGDVYKNRKLPKSVAGLVQSTKAHRQSYSVEVGDVFFTRTSETIEEVGFPSVCTETIEDAVFAGFLIRFRPYKGRLLPDYSQFAFQHSGLRDYFAKEMNLITRASLSQDVLRNMPVPMPPLNEQRIIADHLENLDRQLTEISGQTKDSIAVLKEKRSALITAAVTGQIDVATYARTGGTERHLDAMKQEAGA